MPSSMMAEADDATGTVKITLYFPAPVSSLVHVIRVHPDLSEHEVLGSPVIMSDDYAILYDNAAPMDVPVFYKAYTAGGLVAFDDFTRVVTDHWNPGALNLPGGSGNYASTPDTAALDILGNIDIRARVAFTDWTPSTDQTLISKYNTTGNQRSWHLTLLTPGQLRFAWSTDGTGANTVNADSTAVTGFQPNLIRWVRATLVAATGTVTFYTSENGTLWEQLGNPVVVGATSIFSSTATVNIGARSAGTSDLMTGLFFAAEIRNSAGTVVANPRFDQQGPTITSFADSTGKTWTINGTAAIIEYPVNIDWDLTAASFADFDVNGSVGTQRQTAANTFLYGLVTTGLTDVTVRGTVSIDQDPVTGQSATGRVWARASDANNYYEANLFFTTGDLVQLQLGKRVAGVFTSLGGPITLASSFAANEQWRIALQVEGPEVRARAWPIASSTEPTSFQLTASDTSLTTGTLIGLASRRESGNTNANLVFSWDNLVVFGPAAEPPAETLRYTFTQTIQGWVGEAGTSLAWVSDPAFSTPGALRATRTMGAGFDSLRFNDNDQLPANLLVAGDTFTAWVMVPEGAPGTNWLGRLEVQNSAFTWIAAEDVSLIPGVWIPLAFTGPTAVLENAHAVGVQIGATGVNGPVSVYLDSVYQTFDAVSNYVIIEASPDGWLKDPTQPTLDLRIDNCEVHTPDCLNGDQLVFFKALDTEDYSSASGVFDIVNKAHPMVVGQTRKDQTSTLVLVSRRLEDITSIRNLLSAGTPLILNLPTIYGWGIESFGQDWIQVGDDSSSRLGIDMRKPYRIWSLPFAIVDPTIAFSSGGTGGNGIGVAGATWGDLRDSGLTWDQVSTSGATWLDIAAGEGY